MPRLIPRLLILIPAICFIGGYTVGRKSATAAITKTDPASIPAPSFEADPKDMAEAEIEKEALPAEATALPGPASPPPSSEQHAQRAKQQLITLTDTLERSMQAEVLDATETHLKVRRQSDLRIVQVPVSMLSAEDQAFAAYLWTEQNPAPTNRTNEQMILDELFGGF